MEFAFWLPVIMALVGGIIDVGWYLSRYQNVVRSARSAARAGAATIEDNGVVPGTQIEAAAEAQAKMTLAGVNMPCTPTNGCVVDAVWDTSSTRSAVVVTVTYPSQPMVGRALTGSSGLSQLIELVSKKLPDGAICAIDS